MSRYPMRQTQMHMPPGPEPPCIILYDTPGNTMNAQSWAPNVWRIRFILNYKRLRYRTRWVPLPDVEATLINLRAPPSSHRPNGMPVYALPAIIDPRRNEVVAGATKIAEYLEAAYPARPVFPEGSRAVQTLFVHWAMEVWATPLLVAMAPVSLGELGERSREHFRPGAGFAPSQQQREQAWAQMKEQFDFLARVLDKNSPAGDGDGTVVMGKEVTYADFALCSVLVWIKSMAPPEWVRVRTWNGGRWERLWNRCSEYMDEH